MTLHEHREMIEGYRGMVEVLEAQLAVRNYQLAEAERHSRRQDEKIQRLYNMVAQLEAELIATSELFEVV